MRNFTRIHNVDSGNFEERAIVLIKESNLTKAQKDIAIAKAKMGLIEAIKYDILGKMSISIKDIEEPDEIIQYVFSE